MFKLEFTTVSRTNNESIFTLPRATHGCLLQLLEDTLSEYSFCIVMGMSEVVTERGWSVVPQTK